MKYLANSKEMKSIDAACISDIGIPSLALMERAGLAVYENIKKRYPNNYSAIVIVSKGNNGADGLVIARLLKNAGYMVAYYIVGDTNGSSPEFNVQKAIVDNMGICQADDILGYNFVVDAIFGIGLSKTVEGVHKYIIDRINSNYSEVISVDIPSGISATTGKALGAAVRAKLTITFGLLKLGLVLYPGLEYSGEVKVVDIGFIDEAIAKVAPEVIAYTQEDKNLLPHRKQHSHKGSYGTVMVIAGAYAQAGAAYLSAKAAYKSGAGLVKFYIDDCNRTILQSLLPEAVMSCYEGYDALALKNSLEKVSVIVMGSGLRVREEARRMFEFCMTHFDGSYVLDADIINIIDKKNIDLLRGKRVVLTPHIKEMKNMCDRLGFTYTDNLVLLAKDFSQEYNITIVIKDSRTVVKSPNSNVYLNLSGNNSMAKGGSGDVLGGIIGGFLAQGLEEFEAASLGVYIHGLCGDIARDKMNSYSVLASDLISSLDECLK